MIVFYVHIPLFQSIIAFDIGVYRRIHIFVNNTKTSTKIICFKAVFAVSANKFDAQHSVFWVYPLFQHVCGFKQKCNSLALLAMSRRSTRETKKVVYEDFVEGDELDAPATRRKASAESPAGTSRRRSTGRSRKISGKTSRYYRDELTLTGPP